MDDVAPSALSVVGSDVPGRPQRIAAVAASVKVNVNLESERGGEDKYTRSSEAASRMRDVGRAAPPCCHSSLSTPTAVTAAVVSGATTADTVRNAAIRSFRLGVVCYDYHYHYHY